MNGLAIRNKNRNNRSVPSLFDDFLSDNWFSNYQTPALMEWDEKTNTGNITIEAPGFSKEDIKIESNSEGLVISGEVQDENIRNKLRQTSFSYVLRRSDIDPKTVEAKLENGILLIQIKKAKDKISRMIEIQ